MLYTAWTRNLISLAFHSSSSVAFLSSSLSHLVQVACCPTDTILHYLSSSALISPWTRQLVSFSSAVSIWKGWKGAGPLCIKLPLPSFYFGAALTLPVKRLPLFPQPLSSITMLATFGLISSLHCYTSASSQLEFLFQESEWNLQLVAKSVEHDTAQTSRCPPSPEVRSYFPLQALNCRDWHLVHQECPQDFGQKTFSGNPDWSTGWCIHQDAFTLPTFFTFIFSVMVGMIIFPVLMQKASSTFPHVSYSVLGLAGLKLIWVNSVSFSISSIHLQPGTKSVGQTSSWALCTLDQSRFYKLARGQGKQNHWNGSPCNYSHWSCVSLM